MRIAAQAFESLVIDHFAERCADGLAMALAVSPSCPPDNWQRLSERGLQLAHTIRARRHDDIAPLLGRVTVADHSVVISVNAFLVYSAGRLALIETGSGASFEARQCPIFLLVIPLHRHSPGSAERGYPRENPAAGPNGPR